MRYLLLALALVACNPVFAEAGKAVIGTLTANPANNAVLAVSPSMANAGNTGAYVHFDIICSGTVAYTCAFQVLNASSVVQSTIYIPVPAGDLRSISPKPSFFIPNGYTVRVINATAVVVGSVQASIIYSVDITD